MVRLDPTDFIPLRKIEFLEAQRSHVFVGQLRLIDSDVSSREGKSTLYGFVEEDTAPPRCSKFDTADISNEATVSRLNSATRAFKLSATARSDDDWITLPGCATADKTSTVAIEMTQALSHDTASNASVQSSVTAEATLRRLKGSTSSIEPPLEQQISFKAQRPAPRLSSHVQLAHPLAESSASADNLSLPDFDPSKGITFPAGSYEIILVLDTREIESKSNRDRFSEKLADKGVKLETRALRLGDVCWIAKRLDGLGGEEDECVLDYVLERKRLDDLCSSMRDGRYHEQCVSFKHPRRR